MKMYAYVGIKIQYTILFVQNTVFKIYMDLNPNICICIHFHTYVIDIKIKIYIYKLIWFRTGHQSAFRESFGSERGFKARFASHLVQNGALQSAFRESIWFSRVQIICFSSGLQSTEHMCVYVYIYILYMRYQKGQMCLLKHVSKYI